MPRFTLKEMFLSVTVAAIGMAIVVFLLRSGQLLTPRPRMVLWLASGAVTGGAVFAPFKRPFIGALIGLAVQFALLYSHLGPDLFPPERIS